MQDQNLIKNPHSVTHKGKVENYYRNRYKIATPNTTKVPITYSLRIVEYTLVGTDIKVTFLCFDNSFRVKRMCKRIKGRIISQLSNSGITCHDK